MAKKALGKGLGALLSDIDRVEGEIDSSKITQLNISDIEPNKEQPRKNFDNEKLQILAQSISRHGVISPIIVIKLPNGYYRIIAGERRWRASRMAGLKTIPAIIRDFDEMAQMEVALVENLQREDLNPIEEALGYKALMDKFSFTQEEISNRVSKSRPAVANSLRLLSLPSSVQKMVAIGRISGGHARAILSLEDKNKQEQLSNRIVNEGLSVRQAEAFVQSVKKGGKKRESKVSEPLLLQIKGIESDISRLLGTKVRISTGGKKGKIEIDYYSLDDLHRLLKIIFT